jgi:hypothetical protein
MEINWAPEVVTVRVQELLIDPEAALIVAVPPPTPVASPLPLIAATAALEELQVTEFVRFCVLPSVKVPVAVN